MSPTDEGTSGVAPSCPHRLAGGGLVTLRRPRRLLAKGTRHVCCRVRVCRWWGDSPRSSVRAARQPWWRCDVSSLRGGVARMTWQRVMRCDWGLTATKSSTPSSAIKHRWGYGSTLGKARQAEARLWRIASKYGIGERPAGGDRAGHHALCLCAHLERQNGHGGRSPGGHQPNG